MNAETNVQKEKKEKRGKYRQVQPRPFVGDGARIDEKGWRGEGKRKKTSEFGASRREGKKGHVQRGGGVHSRRRPKPKGGGWGERRRMMVHKRAEKATGHQKNARVLANIGGKKKQTTGIQTWGRKAGKKGGRKQAPR